MKKIKLRRTDSVSAYDTETTGLSPYKGAKIFSYSIGDTEGNVGIYRLDGKARKKNLIKLQDYFHDTSIAKTCHNFKFDRKMTRHLGITIPHDTVWHDTMLMSHLLRNNAPFHSLDYLCWELAGYPREDAVIRAKAKALGGYQNVPIIEMNAYQNADGERGMLLYLLWYEKYILGNPRIFQDYLHEIEVAKTADEMEDFGIDLHMGKALDLISWMEDELEKVQFETIKLYDEPINLNSEDQVAQLLYKKLNFPVPGYTESKKPATGKDFLLELREKYPSPVYDLIFKQRSYRKGVAIVRGYISHATDEGIVHPNLKMNHAITGRPACENPNLLNVSKVGVLKNPFPVPSRQAFKARKGYVLFLVDYAGIEMRLGVEVANCLKMINLMNEGENLHVVAAKLFYTQFRNKKDHSPLYGAAKNAHFAIMYGAGLAQVAKTLNLTIKEATKSLNAYESEFPEIVHLNTTIGKVIKEQGYIDTVFGRRLHVSKMKAYTGLNHMIQATAAQLMKRALIRTHKYQKENWNNEIKLAIPIYDEMIMNYKRSLLSETETILPAISNIMIDMPEITVPLEVEWKMTTTTWDQAKDYHVDYRLEENK